MNNSERAAINKAKRYLSEGDQAVDRRVSGKSVKAKADNLERMFSAQKSHIQHHG